MHCQLCYVSIGLHHLHHVCSCTEVLVTSIEEMFSNMSVYFIYRAADHGNLEALIKLAVAYLYNEGCE